ncbi:MAG: glycosyltransferase [Desulfitobacterium hafniense]|nr:glycosyltransferase [Desulfitobacterium hafniense]
MSNKPARLSLCMIVKNEEAVLARCLKSIYSLVDEMIVVDTGSSDGTIDIANSFGAKIYEFEWKDNFSDARNFSLTKATGEWILVMDADEVMGYIDSYHLKQLLGDNSINGYFLRIVNLLGKPSSFENLLPILTSENLVVRLFRNRNNYWFCGAIHEQVKRSITDYLGEDSLKTAPLTIYHDGYLPEIVESKKKVLRNSRIIVKALENNPEEPFLLYSLGCEYFISENISEATDVFKKALLLTSTREGYLADLLIKLILCHYKLGKLSEMHKISTQYLKKHPSSPDFLFLSAIINIDNGELELAEQQIKKCIKKMPVNPALHLAFREYQLYQALGEIYEKQCLWEKAVRYYYLAIKTQPTYLYPLKKIISIYKLNRPACKISSIIDYCNVEMKLNLLTKLDWNRESDTVIFLIFGVAYNIVFDADVRQVMSARLLAIFSQKHGEIRIRTATLLAKTLITLATNEAMNMVNTIDACKNTLYSIERILLSNESREPEN